MPLEKMRFVLEILTFKSLLLQKIEVLYLKIEKYIIWEEKNGERKDV